MTALPSKTSFTGSTVTQGQFKTALDNLNDFLSGLLGTDGTAASARAALGAISTYAQVISALGYTPPQPGGTGASGTWPVSVSGTAATATTANATNTSNNFQMNSLGIGTAGSGTTGEIRATNNITAYYSDERLKTVIGNIEGALDAIKSLDGVRYTPNAVAAQYGYTDKTEQVGLLAQQVKRVLPQVVVPAPFDINQNADGTEYSASGEHYLTLRYERMIPLLIEGIKELAVRLEKLEAQ